MNGLRGYIGRIKWIVNSKSARKDACYTERISTVEAKDESQRCEGSDIGNMLRHSSSVSVESFLIQRDGKPCLQDKTRGQFRNMSEVSALEKGLGRRVAGIDGFNFPDLDSVDLNLLSKAIFENVVTSLV